MATRGFPEGTDGRVFRGIGGSKAAVAWYDRVQTVAIIGWGDEAKAVRQQFGMLAGEWAVKQRRTVRAALGSLPARRAGLWVLVGDAATFADIEQVRRDKSSADLVVCLPAEAGLVDRCRAWELGASAVLVGAWPREIVAACRAVWRRRFFVGADRVSPGGESPDVTVTDGDDEDAG